MEQSFLCKVCDVKCTGIEPYMMHVNGAKHKRKEQEAKFTISSFDCQICGITCSGIFPYKQHLESEKHIKKEKLKLLSEKCGVAPSHLLGHSELEVSSSTTSFKAEFHEKDENVTPKMIIQKEDKVLPAPNVYQCTTCDKQFTGPAPYEQHMVSNKHKKKLEQNELVLKFKYEKGVFTGVGVSSDKQASISTSASNGDDLAISMETPFTCSICKEKFLLKEMYDLHMSSLSHKVHKEQDFLSQDCFCATCNKVFTSKVPFLQHMESYLHCKNTKRAELLTNTSVGGVSQMAVEFSHGNSPSHEFQQFGLGNKEPVAECYVCAVKLYDHQEVTLHYESEDHYEKQNIYEYKNKVKVFVPEKPFDLLA